MTMNYGYGFQSQPNYFNQMQQGFNTTYVSDIAEAIATKPDVTGKPLFFYNKLNEEIYIKQYDNTGSAPIKTYKLVIQKEEPQTNSYAESFKSLNHKLDDIKKLLTPEIIERGNKKNERNS